MMVNNDPVTGSSDDELDPRLFWRWMGRATRPVIGWCFIGLAALMMLLGWIGVSGESIVAKQLPYLISGGIGGVLVAVLGAYFLATEELRRDSGRLDRLERMVDELHRALLTRSDAPALTNGAGGPGPASPGTNDGKDRTRVRLVMVPNGETYHDAACAMVAGKPDLVSLTPGAARQRKLRPCPMCMAAAEATA